MLGTLVSVRDVVELFRVVDHLAVDGCLNSQSQALGCLWGASMFV